MVEQSLKRRPSERKRGLIRAAGSPAVLLALLSPRAAAWGAPPDVSDLPLMELPVQSDSRALVVLLSGDGGWAGLVRDLSAVLNGKGVSVVGLDCLRYFWGKRTPEETAADPERVLARYLAAWDKEEVVLAGYSRDTDALSSVTTRLPAERQKQLRLLALSGPAPTVQFQPTALGLINVRGSGPLLPLVPDLQKLQGHHFAGGLGVIGQRIAAELASGPRWSEVAQGGPTSPRKPECGGE
jgi:type IV secretory pathway VirJ component